jgi:hypothetical protein
MVFEGTSEIMRLFIAREALDPHLKLGGDLFDPRAPISRKLSTALRAGLHYAGWYPGLWNPFAPAVHVHPRLAPHLRYAARGARRLARTLFHAMAVHAARLERKQALLGRLVEIGTDLFAIAATCSRADRLHARDPEAHAGVLELADLFSREARRRIEDTFRAGRRSHDRQGYRLAQEVTGGSYRWLEKGAVDFPFR